MGKKTFYLLISCVLLVSYVSGCNSNSASFKEESPNPNNTLVWNLSYSDIDSWDPHMSNTGVVADIGRQIFEGLTVLGEKGYQLGAAESFTMSANIEGIENTVYTFKLRQDAKWSDGEDVTANDFEYGFRRACEKKNDVSHIYVQYIKGADKYINGVGSLDDVKVTALDQYTLEIELNEPTPYFMEVLTNHQFYPVRKDIVEVAGEGWETNPETCISNGPYKLHSYEPGSYILLSKNNSYYGNEDVKIPYIKCIINTQNKNINLMYNNDEVHIMEITPYGNLDGEDLLYSDYIRTSYIIFNTGQKPFDDINVRKAFSYGIDSKYYSERVYLDSIQAYGFMPPNMKLSDGTAIGNKRKSADYLMNVNSEKAKQLLNTAGYKDGFHENNSVYGFDYRNRVEEIDKNGYFEDSAGYKFDKYITSEHFELYYSSDNVSNKFYASNSLKILEEEYDSILEFLNVEEKNMPVVKINMYDEYEPLRQSFIKETNFDPDIMNGIYGTYINSNNFYFTFRYKGKKIDIKEVVLHEFTHNVTMALASVKPRVDWLWDGVAMYIAQDKDRYAPYYEEMISSGIPEIYTLKNNDRDRYIYGYSMVEYIVEQYGREKLVELLREYGDIEKVLNITESEFRDDWIEFLKGKLH